MDLATLAIIATIGAFILGIIGFIYKVIFGEWNFLQWWREHRKSTKFDKSEEVGTEEHASRIRPLDMPVEMKGSTIAGFVGKTERGGINPTLVTSWDEFKRIFGRELIPSISFTPHAVRGFFENGGPCAYIARVVGKNSSAATLQIPTIEEQQSLKVEAMNLGGWGNRLVARIQNGTRTGVRLTIFYYTTDTPLVSSCLAERITFAQLNTAQAEIEEDYDNISFEPGGPNYVLDYVNSRSQLVTVSWQDAFLGPARPNNVCAKFSGGSDGDPISAEQFIGNDTNECTGLAALENIQEISLLCIPDHVHPSHSSESRSKIEKEVVNQCERLNDRFAILSVNKGLMDVSNLSPPFDSSFAAVYYPWIRVADPSNDSGVLIPPIGHIAGVYARSDAEMGVHKAPSNLKVFGLVHNNKSKKHGSLEFDVTDKQLDTLERLSINAIRDFGTNDDIRVISAFTMSIDDTWKYVNVRRFSLFLIESISRGTRWVVLEKYDGTLWGKVTDMITEFLTKTWEDGALRGDTAEEAFFVKCDRTTMTEDDILNGRLICKVGVSMVDPAKAFELNFVMNIEPPANGLTMDT